MMATHRCCCQLLLATCDVASGCWLMVMVMVLLFLLLLQRWQKRRHINTSCLIVLLGVISNAATHTAAAAATPATLATPSATASKQQTHEMTALKAKLKAWNGSCHTPHLATPLSTPLNCCFFCFVAFASFFAL